MKLISNLGKRLDDLFPRFSFLGTDNAIYILEKKPFGFQLVENTYILFEEDTASIICSHDPISSATCGTERLTRRSTYDEINFIWKIMVFSDVDTPYIMSV